MSRPSWDHYFMAKAYLASGMSTCASGRKVGAVFVKDKRDIATGFNAVPSGYPHPKYCPRREAQLESGAGLDMCVCKHAEENAITNATRHGVNLNGSTVYVTTQPCQSCMGNLANVGVVKVIYHMPYNSPKAFDIAQYAGIEVEEIDDFNLRSLFLSVING